jgi:hypothetical protein
MRTRVHSSLCRGTLVPVASGADPRGAMTRTQRIGSGVLPSTPAGNWALCMAAAVMLAVGACAAHAAAPAYQYTAPAGWTRTEQAGSVAFTPPLEPAGSVVLLVLPLAPRLADLDTQLNALRVAFEGSLGLRDMREPQRQQYAGTGFETRSHYAVYSSNAGDRYFAVMGRAEAGAVGTLLFVATSGAAYDRMRGTAADLFNGLRIVSADSPPASPATVLPAAGNRATETGVIARAPTAQSELGRGGYRGPGIIGVWTGTRTMRDFSRGYSMLIAFPAWYVFFDDGQVLQTFPKAGLAGFEREAFRAQYPLEFHSYAFDGATGQVQRQEGAAPWSLKQIGPNHLQVDGATFHRCPDVNGLRLQGSWYQRSVVDADDPNFTQRPRGMRPLIHFTADGRFDDEGLFVVAMPSDPAADREGVGSYEIRDFSIILRYDDGRVRQEAFPGRGPELSVGGGPDDRIFIRDAGLLKR